MKEWRNLLLTHREQPDLESFLMSESGLPGPRGNLELAAAAAEILDEAILLSFIRKYPPETAPTNHPGEFVAFCGTQGLGRLVTEGRDEYLDLLRKQAKDPRWRLREAAAMALQKIGRWRMDYLLKVSRDWSSGDMLLKRAVVAGLAEPGILKQEADCLEILDIFDQITRSVETAQDSGSKNFMVLRQALGYAWSVLVCAIPGEGKLRMERWMNSANRQVQWIMKENLKKNRLEKLDREWVERMRKA